MSNGPHMIRLGEAIAPSDAVTNIPSSLSGQSLGSGLSALSELAQTRHERQTIRSLSHKLENGMSIVDVVPEATKTLSQPLSALIVATLESGRLDILLSYGLEQSRRWSKLQMQIWLSLTYPLLLCSFAVMVCHAIVLNAVPQFDQMFADFGNPVSPAGQVLVQYSQLMLSYGGMGSWATYTGMISCWILVALFVRSSFAKRWISSIPVIGKAFQLAALSEFCELLAVLLESRLAMVQALRFTSEACSDRWLQRKCQQVIYELEHGATPTSALEMAGLPKAISLLFRNQLTDEPILIGLRGLSQVYSARCTVRPFSVPFPLELFTLLFVLGFMAMMIIVMFNELLGPFTALG